MIVAKRRAHVHQEVVRRSSHEREGCASLSPPALGRLQVIGSHHCICGRHPQSAFAYSRSLSFPLSLLSFCTATFSGIRKFCCVKTISQQFKRTPTFAVDYQVAQSNKIFEMTYQIGLHATCYNFCFTQCAFIDHEPS